MDFTDVNHFFYIRPLYIKLDVFSHEEEYRFLIIVSRKQSKLKPDILKLEYIEIDFDPNELFDEIVLDPRMDEDMADLYKELIRSLGYNKEITRSEMYDVSSFMDDVLS